MFTGIIEEVGIVDQIRRGGEFAKLRIRARTVLGRIPDPADPFARPTKPGDSIAVNGICLTVTDLEHDHFTADVMPETLRRTAFNRLAPGSRVNLERAMAANGRFGGHIVSGHIDGIGTVRSRRREGNAVWFDIAAGDRIAAGIVEKGSIAIDGISLTVAEIRPEPGNASFSVSIIPHTLAETALADREPGDPVNLETDMLGKYVFHLMGEGGALLKEGSEETGSPAGADPREQDRKLKEMLMSF